VKTREVDREKVKIKEIGRHYKFLPKDSFGVIKFPTREYSSKRIYLQNKKTWHTQMCLPVALMRVFPGEYLGPPRLRSLS
jgi:hypothetical protein